MARFRTLFLCHYKWKFSKSEFDTMSFDYILDTMLYIFIFTSQCVSYLFNLIYGKYRKMGTNL